MSQSIQTIANHVTRDDRDATPYPSAGEEVPSRSPSSALRPIKKVCLA